MLRVEPGGVITSTDVPKPGVAPKAGRVCSRATYSVICKCACSSGAMKASEVLAAMAVPDEIAGCVIRVSFGPATSEADTTRFLGEWRQMTAKAKAA